jgi:hypothetical protein
VTAKSKTGKQVGWHISEDLRELVNLKAGLRRQSVDDFVAECLEANTEDVKQLREQYTREKRSGKRPVIVLSRHESKA